MSDSESEVQIQQEKPEKIEEKKEVKKESKKLKKRVITELYDDEQTQPISEETVKPAKKAKIPKPLQKKIDFLQGLGVTTDGATPEEIQEAYQLAKDKIKEQQKLEKQRARERERDAKKRLKEEKKKQKKSARFVETEAEVVSIGSEDELDDGEDGDDERGEDLYESEAEYRRKMTSRRNPTTTPRASAQLSSMKQEESAVQSHSQPSRFHFLSTGMSAVGNVLLVSALIMALKSMKDRNSTSGASNKRNPSGIDQNDEADRDGRETFDSDED